MVAGMSQQYRLYFSASGGRESCVEALRIGVKGTVKVVPLLGNLTSAD